MTSNTQEGSLGVSPLDVESVEAALVKRMRSDIVTLTLPPGQRLRVQSAAMAYGVSPLPVRQALRTLESEGLVISRPRQGCWVAPLTAGDAELVMTVGASVEARLTRLAADRLSAADLTEVRRLREKRDEASARGDLDEQLAAAFAGRVLVMERAERPTLLNFAVSWHQRQLRYVRAIQTFADPATLEQIDDMYHRSTELLLSGKTDAAAESNASMFIYLIDVCANLFTDDTPLE